MSIQTLIAPDGSRLVVLAEADYEALVAAAEDTVDIAAAERALRETGDFLIPGVVLEAELAGRHPVAAWRVYRRMTQAELAQRAGLSQPYVARMERGAIRSPRGATIALLARALAVPDWALTQE
jgi:DNA-binding XRE family transcriptional regulator